MHGLELLPFVRIVCYPCDMCRQLSCALLLLIVLGNYPHCACLTENLSAWVHLLYLYQPCIKYAVRLLVKLYMKHLSTPAPGPPDVCVDPVGCSSAHALADNSYLVVLSADDVETC